LNCFDNNNINISTFRLALILMVVWPFLKS